MKRKERIEEVTRELLEKKYGKEYSLEYLKKSESPDYIGNKIDGRVVGLEICEVTFKPMTHLMSESPKIRDVKPLDEIKKGVDKMLPFVAVSWNGSEFVSRAYTYTGEQPDTGKEIVTNAITTMEAHLKKLQKYASCDLYELAVILPLCVVSDLFPDYCSAIIKSLPPIKTDEYKRFFHAIHLMGANENYIMTLSARLP